MYLASCLLFVFLCRILLNRCQQNTASIK